MVRVMVVDDAAFMRAFLKQMLTDVGFQVVAEAKDGDEAVKLFMHMRPDVVTMDITMPEMNGIDALNEIRKVDPQAKVIMCSAVGQHNMILNAIKAGASDFIVKPFQKERVLEAIKKVMPQ
ncbi:chemotaxis protein CheY [Gordoniibacillus kamchatkensis]|uniref:Chemotaxis protein CheY n=1 Tax=Gordoniibacillus kamchatkensis TaxID=1590651 RepID=A0ABR5AJU1_9BACL|nr:response regulator [Paenibacillus sp. VKM B-2647]KIL41306.1 chemotaxis protein CheY [Paenibacillus sp. VKM B-2647]